MLFGLSRSWRPLLVSLAVSAALLSGVPGLRAQSAPAGATAAAPLARQIGTVKRIEGSTLTLTTDAGQGVTVDVPAAARVLQLAPGSKDLKSAQPGSFTDIAVGDRVLATGSANGAGFSAVRVILMRSSDIDQKRQGEAADWQRRGSGGLVSAVDPATGTITVTSGTRKTEVLTTDKTIFRRYAGDSVRFEDAKPGTLAEIHVGDQIRVRGRRSDAGPQQAEEQAEEIVSGSFRNVSGTLLSVDATGSAISLKDLTTKRNVAVKITPNTAIHMLSPEQAAGFAARQHPDASPNGSQDGRQGGGARVGGTVGGAGRSGAGATGASAPASGGASAGSGAGGVQGGEPGGSGGARPGGGRPGGGRSAGGDLSQMVARLPALPVSSLHTGDAVMIVASQASPADPMTAITVLSGVGPILAAAPSGSEAMVLSPWSVGGGAPEGGTQ